jgi:hypothetical protein
MPYAHVPIAMLGFSPLLAGPIILGAAILIGVVAVNPAEAHSWYPAGCCNGDDMGGDCHPVPCEELSEQNDGGYHWHGFNFTPAQIHPSQDKHCHVCVSHYDSPDRYIPHCVFIQNGT